VFQAFADRRYVVSHRPVENRLSVIAAYLTVVILHGLWDGVPTVLSKVVPSGLDVLIAQVAIGMVGLFILWRRWREGARLALKQQEAVALSESATGSGLE
jgi:uncharacterized membrane protein YccC